MNSHGNSSETGIRWGFRAAMAAALVSLASAFMSPLTGIFWAAVYLAVGWGIRRRQLYAAIAGSWLAVLPGVIEFVRIGPGAKPLEVFLLAGGQIVFAGFFLWAALNLRGERSSPARVPWMALMAFEAIASLCLFGYLTPTESMEDTLLVGDGILADHVSWYLGRTPKRGDIIIFRYPGDRNKSFIKRVVGIPGDRLHTHDRKLYRNGSAVVEDYAVYKNPGSDIRREFPSFIDPAFTEGSDGLLLRKMLETSRQNDEIVVPDGEYFVLGDNRDNSLDSRYFGFVDRSDIVASPVIIFASYDIDPTSDSAMSRTIFNMRWSRVLKLL